MDYNQILTTLGITQGRLETIIIFTVIAIGIGIVCVMYWKFLLAGFFALVIIFVFSRSEGTPEPLNVIAKTAPPVVIDETPPPKVEVKPEPVQPVVAQMSREQKEFMEDCLSLADKKSICEELWKQRSQ
jgi:hypothetical protein